MPNCLALGTPARIVETPARPARHRSYGSAIIQGVLVGILFDALALVILVEEFEPPST